MPAPHDLDPDWMSEEERLAKRRYDAYFAFEQQLPLPTKEERDEMTTITKAELNTLATEVLAHRLAHWGAGPAPKGRVSPHPTEPVPCELAWNTTRAAIRAGTLEVS